MNIANFLSRTAQVDPARPAVFLGDRCLYDYATLAHRAACIAGSLTGPQGLVEGERVAVFIRTFRSTSKSCTPSGGRG